MLSRSARTCALPELQWPLATPHRLAHTGSAHVLSPSLGDEPDLHRGPSPRVMDGVPWLRGFVCHDLHVFVPEDRWILAR